MSCSASQLSVESEFYYERFFNHSPHSDKRKMRQFRESRATISRWHVTIACDVHCVHSWPDRFISVQVADTPSARTQLRDRVHSMSAPEICQNKHHLQNKSVLLMDNSGKNKQRWLLFHELFIAGAARAVGSAELHDRSSLFPHLSTQQCEKDCCCHVHQGISLLSPEMPCMPFTLLKIFSRANTINWGVKVQYVGCLCTLSETNHPPKWHWGMILLGMLL